MRESGDRHEIMERTSDAGAARRVRKNKNAVIDREDTEGAGWTSSGCIHSLHIWISFCGRDWRVFRAQREAPRHTTAARCQPYEASSRVKAAVHE